MELEERSKEYKDFPDFSPPYDKNGKQSSRRERECMSYLASIIGPTGREDGGAGLDTLEGWCFRVKKLVDELRKD